MTKIIKIVVNIRRYDLHDNPPMETAEIALDANLSYDQLKKAIENYFELANDESKVIKIRNQSYALIPLMSLLDPERNKGPFIIDITRTAIAGESSTNLLQDAYLDAVRQKLRSMESRVSQAEVLLPQLQWRRQSHLDETVNTLSTRVAFLNRRIDELMPAEWKSKMPTTIS